MRPLWALPGPELNRQIQQRNKEREWIRRWESSAVGKFINAANKEFPHIYGAYRHFQNSVIVDYEPLKPKLKEDQSDFGQIVIIRLIYVIKSKRQNGVALDLLHHLVAIADQTGCCLLGVCNPFERLGNPDPNETVEAVARSFANGSYPIDTLSLATDYLGPQKRMGQRFKLAGFQQVDISEATANHPKFSREHLWIYIPDGCDEQFRTDIDYRLLNSM